MHTKKDQKEILQKYSSYIKLYSVECAFIFFFSCYSFQFFYSVNIKLVSLCPAYKKADIERGN